MTDATGCVGAATVTVKPGDTAELYYNASDRHKSFQGYRVFKYNTSFAFINVSISNTGKCNNGALKKFCSERATFEKLNETHLILTIANTTESDSGCYAVGHLFGGFADNDKEWKGLNVKLNIEHGKEVNNH